ncbi:uncharacterized protein LOC106054126 [Biomphalaria glabrata]|uniref:Uncharacterized protein LOC106054126 n=1 Tax=Biomphalaria glabrata TaxID=6526 RepID=A0A9U8DX35_BIOGL|nr:uncharacterized protein LOC106054126 [Biomphalaria glabrata]
MISYMLDNNIMSVNIYSVVTGLLLPWLTHGQDPTTICQPPQIQVSFYNFLDMTYGIYSIDFTKSLAAKVEALSQIRTVYDFKTFIAYDITSSGNCTKHAMSWTEVITQCLPASAKKVSPDNVYLGYGSEKINIQTWQIDLINVTLQVAFTFGTNPVYPLVRHAYRPDFKTPASIVIFYNSENAVNPSQFIIPSSCITP